MEKYIELQPHIQLEIRNALDKYSRENEFKTSRIPLHEHTGIDSKQVKFVNLAEKRLFIVKSLDGAEAQTAANYGVFFIAPYDCGILSVTEVHQVAGTDGGSVTLNIEKLSSGVALGSGQEILSTPFSLKSTANIVQDGVLTNIIGYKQLKKGERLALKDVGTLTSLVGVCIIIEITY